MADILMLTDKQMDYLWKWANRTKYDRPQGLGLNGMPLLSVGRCIEFLLDHGIPMKELMAALTSDFHDVQAQILDILWDSVRVVLAKPRPLGEQLAWIKPAELKPKGSMQQWVSNKQWKELTDGEMKRVWSWALKIPDTTRIFYDEHDRPMLSIGRLLQFLVDNGMSLAEIFRQCRLYENQEWSKMQLMDVLWVKVKTILKLPVVNYASAEI